MAALLPGACAALAEDAGEPLAGTASSDGRVFFLVRYAGAWPRKALPASDLPEALKERLRRAEKASGGRAQLVRGPSRDADAPELYVVRTVPGERFVLRFAFPSYEAMAELDVEEVAARGAHPRAEVLREPLFLVCTHGRRDPCCAARGTEVFHAIAGMRPGRIFQASHLGGHRFAAVALGLPDGLCYGRVSAEEARAWVEATEAGRIFDLGRLRGRTCYEPPAQAAEVFLREELGELGIDALSLEGTARVGEGRWAVRFRRGAEAHEVVVAEERLPVMRPSSCGDEPGPVTRFSVARS